MEIKKHIKGFFSSENGKTLNTKMYKEICRKSHDGFYIELSPRNSEVYCLYSVDETTGKPTLEGQYRSLEVAKYYLDNFRSRKKEKMADASLLKKRNERLRKL